MQIIIAGRSAHFPDHCACCFGPAEQSCSVSERVGGGGGDTTSTWFVPYCTQCAEHVRSLHIGIGIFLLFFFSLGFFYLQYRLIWKPRREKRAQAMCKPECSDIYGVRYQFDKQGDRHAFLFPSDEYARAFVEANGDVIVNPSPEVAGLLGRSIAP